VGVAGHVFVVGGGVIAFYFNFKSVQSVQFNLYFEEKKCNKNTVYKAQQYNVFSGSTNLVLTSPSFYTIVSYKDTRIQGCLFVTCMI
jgi:hypothetical protein